MKTFLAALSVFLLYSCGGDPVFAQSKAPTAQDLKNDFTLFMSDAARRYSDCIDQAMLNAKIGNAYMDTAMMYHALRDSLSHSKEKKK